MLKLIHNYADATDLVLGGTLRHSRRYAGDLFRSRSPSGRAAAALRSRRGDRRQSLGFRVGSRRATERVLAIRPERRRPGRRLDAGAGLVFAHRHLLRDSRLRAARPADRDARRPRPNLRRRQYPDPARHLPRPQTGPDVRGQSARRPRRRLAHRRGERDGERVHRRRRGGSRAAGLEPRLCVSVAGARDRLGLRGRGPNSVQELALSAPPAAGLVAQHRAPGQAFGLRGFVVSGDSCQRHVHRPIGESRRPVRHASRPGRRSESRGDRQSERRADRERLRLRHGQPAARRERPLGVDRQPDAQRDREARLFAGRVGCRTARLRPAPGTVLRGKAAVLSREQRAVPGSAQPDLHAPHRAAGRRRAAHRHGGRIGRAYTDRIDGWDYNRVLDVDSRLVFKDIYGLTLQVAGSRTRVGNTTTTAPLWVSQFTIQHRVWGLRSVFAGISDKFTTASGFIGRNGIVHSYVDPSWTAYGKPGGLVQRFTGDILVDGIWQYQNFVHGRNIQDQKLHFNGNATLRGGWNLGAGYFVESFGYDSALYASYRLEVPKSGGGLDTIPFVGQPTIGNGEYIVQIGTPQWKHFSGGGFFLQGHDENFFEWASADLLLLSVDVSYRPTDRLRNTFDDFWQQVNRRTDGSLVNVGRVARAKVEYQISRPLFVRLVGQYIQDKTDSLRDDSRTNAPILIAGPGGVTRTTPSATNLFHVDALLSYQPVPGTVLFAGYGSNMLDDDAFRFRGLTRTDDAFFVKLSYLFRL